MNVTLGDLNYILGVGEENTFLQLAGNLCGTNASKITSVFQRTITHAKGKLFLSLQGCYNMDSQTLAALAIHQKNRLDLCREIVLVDVPSQIMKILELAQITAMTEVFPSIEEAEKKYGHSVH